MGVWTYECNNCGEVVEVDDPSPEHIDFGVCVDCFEEDLEHLY